MEAWIDIENNNNLLPSDDCLKLSVVMETQGYKQIVGPLTFRCRKDTQSFLFTFRDHDNSIAHAAVIKPHSDCPSNGCPIVLTLSGVGVTPSSQADSYKYMNSKKSKENDWIFGLKDSWILAPEREGAHNWEGKLSLICN